MRTPLEPGTFSTNRILFCLQRFVMDRLASVIKISGKYDVTVSAVNCSDVRNPISCRIFSSCVRLCCSPATISDFVYPPPDGRAWKEFESGVCLLITGSLRLGLRPLPAFASSYARLGGATGSIIADSANCIYHARRQRLCNPLRCTLQAFCV